MRLVAMKKNRLEGKNINLLLHQLRHKTNCVAAAVHRVTWYWLCLPLHYIYTASVIELPHIESYYMNNPLGGVIAALDNTVIT